MKIMGFVAGLFACLAIAGLAGAAAPTIQESDVQRLVGVGSPLISPDGKSALVLVSRIAWNDDKRNSEIVLVDLAAHVQRVAVPTRDGLSSPSFSPDGTSIAFIANAGTAANAKSQVFTVPLGGGDPKQVTNASSGVDQYAWRPDSRAIAYTSEDGTPTRTGADRFRDSFVFTTQPIVDRDPPHVVRLFVIPIAGGIAEQLTFGDESVVSGEAESTLAWAPDGSRIAVTIAPDPILNDESNSRIAIVDVASRNLHYLTTHTAWEADAIWSPDGTHIAYVNSGGDPQVNLTQLYVTTPAGGGGASVSGVLDRNVADAAWSRDSSRLYFTAPDATTLALYEAPLGQRPQRIDLRNLVLQSRLDGAIGADGSLVFVASSTKQPAELYYRSAAGSIAELTAFNSAIAQLDLGHARRITFSTTTGIRGDAVLYTPPDFTPTKRYPLVVYIHGGPTSSSMESFDFYSQVMADRGWLVLRPNYRGSNNLGLAYERAVLYDPEVGPGKDIMAAVRALQARGIVDSSRIAVCGWSYGGIMTAWMISKYHIWSAAVSGASVNDWITDYGTADDSLADVDLFHGSPFLAGNATEWNRASAIWYAKDVTTPVLILSDVGDNRDPFATSSMYWRALRDNHKEATLRVWPVDGHFPSDPVRQADVYHYWIGFIAQHFAAAR